MSRYIVFRENEAPPEHQPAFLLVEFPTYIGPSFIEGQPNLVPVTAITTNWVNKGNQLSRTQFPLMPGWSITIHKSQASDAVAHHLLFSPTHPAQRS